MRVTHTRRMKTVERNNKDFRVIIAAVSLALLNHRGALEKEKKKSAWCLKTVRATQMICENNLVPS